MSARWFYEKIMKHGFRLIAAIVALLAPAAPVLAAQVPTGAVIQTVPNNVLNVAPSAAMGPADRTALQAALNGTGDIVIAGATLDKDDLVDFYKARGYRPAWDFSGEENADAFAGFLDSIGRVIDWHGLERADYPFDALRKLAASADPQSRVRLELLVTDTLLRLAGNLHGDDIDLGDLYPGWDFHRAEIDIPGALEKAVAAHAIGAFIDGLAPKNPAYVALAEALRRYRAMPAWPPIAPGGTLQPGDDSLRVAQLEARLAAEGFAPAATAKKAMYFGGALRQDLKTWQARHGLPQSGIVDAQTLHALNVPRGARIDQIRANMERWRHMPDDFPPPNRVTVNIPEAQLTVTEDGKAVYEDPAIVGKVDRKTPFIGSVIRSMVINPIWLVPKDIAQKDILPKLREDPHYLEELGFTIKGDAADPYGEHIDWKALKDQEFDFRLRQESGKLNSLGRIKFNFDNTFAVYIHGTPHQELFAQSRRALSSGCVRLRDPEKVAAILLAGNPGDWTVARIEKDIAAQKTRWLDIKDPIPVFFVYWTVFQGQDGQIQFRNDVYGYDKFLMDTLRPSPPKSQASGSVSP